MLPDDLPKWRTVNEYYYQWSKKNNEEDLSLLEQLLKKIVGEERLKLGRSYTSSFLIVDAQSVKNTGIAMEKGDDAGKKVSGIKRHIASRYPICHTVFW